MLILQKFVKLIKRRGKYLKFPALLCFFLLCGRVYAQDTYTQVIRGTVVDHATSLPLPGANVVLLGAEPAIGTVTDGNGRFRLKNVPVGRQSIQVTFIGYKDKVLANLNVLSGKELILTVAMEEVMMQMDEVVIRSDARKDLPINEMALISARSFTIEETERYAGSVGDPARMASNFAGVAVMSDQQNEIVIRGNSPMGVQWRLDGMDIPNPNHFGALGTTGGGISMINNNTLSNSDFYTGAFPAEYGDVLSGVFDLNMRNGNNERWEYTLQTGFNGIEAGAEGPVSRAKGSSFLLNYRYSMLLLVDKIIGAEALGITDIPYYHDLSFKFNFPHKKFGRFTITGLGGISGIDEEDSEKDTSDWSSDLQGSDYRFGTRMGTLAASHVYYFSNETRLESTIGFSGVNSFNREDTLTLTAMEPAPNSRQNAWQGKLQFSLNLHHKINPANLLDAGLNVQVLFYNFEEEEWQNSSGMVPLIKVNGSSAFLKSYFQWQRKFSDFLTLNAGFNGLFFGYNRKFSLDPRLSLKWQVVPGHALSVGTGLFSQLPEDFFYFVPTDLADGSTVLTNKGLGFMRSAHIVAGYDFVISGTIRLKTEAYYQYLFNIPVKENVPAYSMLNFGDDSFSSIPIIDSLVSDGTGRNFGIELTLEKFLSNGFYFLMTGSMFSSKYRGWDRTTRHTAFDQNFVINTLAGKEFIIRKKNFLTLDLRLTWAGGMRYLPFHTEKVDENYYIRVDDWDRAYEQRRSDYFRINLRIGYRINLRKTTLEIAIDMLNLTNRQNIWFQYYDPSTGSIRTVYQLPFIPVPLIRLQF
jgi:hypothetical protein